MGDLTFNLDPGPGECFWPTGCANSYRCRKFRGCIAAAQSRELRNAHRRIKQEQSEIGCYTMPESEGGAVE